MIYNAYLFKMSFVDLVLLIWAKYSTFTVSKLLLRNLINDGKFLFNFQNCFDVRMSGIYEAKTI